METQQLLLQVIAVYIVCIYHYQQTIQSESRARLRLVNNVSMHSKRQKCLCESGRCQPSRTETSSSHTHRTRYAWPTVWLWVIICEIKIWGIPRLDWTRLCRHHFQRFVWAKPNDASVKQPQLKSRFMIIQIRQLCYCLKTLPAST